MPRQWQQGCSRNPAYDGLSCRLQASHHSLVCLSPFVRWPCAVSPKQDQRIANRSHGERGRRKRGLRGGYRRGNGLCLAVLWAGCDCCFLVAGRPPGKTGWVAVRRTDFAVPCCTAARAQRGHCGRPSRGVSGIAGLHLRLPPRCQRSDVGILRLASLAARPSLLCLPIRMAPYASCEANTSPPLTLPLVGIPEPLDAVMGLPLLPGFRAEQPSCWPQVHRDSLGL